MSILNTTVLMPVHGEAPYLNEAIDSVLKQTKKNLELLIVFDRPNQRAVNAVEQLQTVDVRIRYVFSDTPGISAALNLGISQCSTTFIARLDCDDLMEKDRLEKQETILQDEKVVCVGSQMRIMDRFGSTIRHTHYPTKFNEIKSSLRIRNVIAHPSVMYKKSAVEHVGGYRSEFNGSEDYDLWIRLSNVGQLVNLNESLTNYRIHENQASSKNKAIQIQLDANVRQRNFSKLRDKPGLLSAYLINEAINSFGIQRVYRMITATLVNPIVVLRFLIWQFLPEVIANEK